MARMRLIGTTLDDGYRDDLNFNFGLLEALIGESNGLTEALRQEMLEKIYNLQTQIDMLTGENIGELLARLNDAIRQALTAAQEARTAKTATEEATALAIAAKELAIASATLADEKAAYAEGKAILAQEAADNANQEAANLGQMKVAVVQATQDANIATSNANQATEEAQTATNAINAVLPNVTGLENLQEWSSTIAYKKNNFVTFEGNGYMALQNNINISPPSFPTLSNDDWAMLVQKGEKGEQGTGVRILGTLVNESELPSVGEPGDAYLINGDLYVWSDTTNDWTNVGTIKGPKGEQGIQGPKGDKGDKGDPGEDADVEAINQQIDTLRTEVTEQLDQMKPKVDNSWQKGVYNDTDITNLSSVSASRIFHIYDWKAPVNNLEQVSIAIPGVNFSGTVKVSVAGNYNNSDGSGAFEYETYFLKVGNTVHTYNRTIYKADKGIATEYYFPDFNQNEHIFTIPIVRKPNAINNLTVKVELITVQIHAFNSLKDAYIVYEDLGTSWHSYPWTPQASQIPTSSMVNFWDNSMWNNIVNGRGYVVGGVAADLGTFTPIQWESFFTKHIARQMGTFRCFINKDHAGVDTQTYATYGVLTTIKPWTDLSGGSIIQYFEAHDVVLKRYESLPDRNWTPWIVVQSFEVDIKKLFQSASDVKTNVAAAITDKGITTSPTATGAQMAANIRAIPTGSKTQSGAMQIPAFSGSQTVSVNVYLPFVAKNALSNMGGFVFLNGYPYGATGVAGPYTRNITVAGTTLTFTFAMGGGTGSFAGGTGTYFASE